MENTKSNIFKSSFLELGKTKSLVTMGLLIACKVVLDLCTIQVTSGLHISFEFLVDGIVCMLFGPVVGVLYGLVGDIMCYLIYPKGPFLIGFTLIAMASAFFYGIMFYKKKPTILRVAISHTVGIIIFNMALTTYAIHLLYGMELLALLTTRIIKAVILLPFEIALLYFFLETVRTRILKNFHR